jgi:hypothetical protein
VDERDVALRNLTYRLFVECGRAPTVDEVAAEARNTPEETGAGWQRLHDAHALVLYPGTTQLRMANPFSAVPTPYRVEAAGRSWYANCAWDAFGICSALHVDGQIESTCPDCGGRIDVAVRGGRPDDGDLLFHCLVPASRWWDDIAFT